MVPFCANLVSHTMLYHCLGSSILRIIQIRHLRVDVHSMIGLCAKRLNVYLIIILLAGLGQLLPNSLPRIFFFHGLCNQHVLSPRQWFASTRARGLRPCWRLRHPWHWRSIKWPWISSLICQEYMRWPGCLNFVGDSQHMDATGDKSIYSCADSRRLHAHGI